MGLKGIGYVILSSSHLNRLLHATVYFSNVDCHAIRAQIALKLGRLLSFMVRNACKVPWKNENKKSASVGKHPDIRSI